MKSIKYAIVSAALILALCGCGANTTSNRTAPNQNNALNGTNNTNDKSNDNMLKDGTDAVKNVGEGVANGVSDVGEGIAEGIDDLTGNSNNNNNTNNNMAK